MIPVDLRAVPHALIGSPGLHRRLLDRDAAVRAPLATARQVGFVQLEAGIGASTIAALLSGLIAQRRTQPVLAVDLSGDERGVAGRLGVGTTTPSSALRGRARTSTDAADGLVVGPQGQFVLNPGRPAVDAPTTWVSEVAPIVRFFDVVLADFGVRHPMQDLAAVAALCDVVCIVSTADRESAEVGASLVAAIRELPEQPDVVLALVDAAGVAGMTPLAVGGHAGVPVVAVPADRGLAVGNVPVGFGARAALLELAAALIVSGATGVAS